MDKHTKKWYKRLSKRLKNVLLGQARYNTKTRLYQDGYKKATDFLLRHLQDDETNVLFVFNYITNHIIQYSKMNDMRLPENQMTVYTILNDFENLYNELVQYIDGIENPAITDYTKFFISTSNKSKYKITKSDNHEVKEG